jgi:lincosamide nucleotidyltransferase A/C/D/E
MAVDRRRHVRQARVAGLAVLDPLYRRFKYSAASRLLDIAPLRWLRYRMVPGMAAGDVLEVIDTLAAAGVPCWLVGGWGVDALVGRQTRKRPDVDVAVGRPDADHAVRALEGLGFAVVQREILPAWMPTMIVLRDDKRRWIELMAVDVPAPAPEDESRPRAMRFQYTDDSFTEGALDGRAVRCLSAPVQPLFHTGYPPRAGDRHDVKLLTIHFGLAIPEGYA